jgi:predicted dehydrogenase
MTIRIGLVGLGAIALKQHLPALAASPDFTLVAVASLAGEVPGGDVPLYRDHLAMLAAHPEITAVAICTPPRARLAVAADVLRAGRHVLLEKPPAATAGALDHLVALAARERRVLHTAWHSQYNAAVEEARRRLAGRPLASMHIDWKEDVHKYHPGQDWIWQAGGFGVFDAGINGLSILSRVLDPLPFVTDAVLRIPADAEVPIAATVRFDDGQGTAMTGDFDWSWTAADKREIHFVTRDGSRLALTASGGVLTVDGVEVAAAPRREYPDIYADFATLLASGRSSIDAAPLRLVADIFLLGRPERVAPARR